MEAVRDALQSLSTPQVALKIVFMGLGPVTEADVNLAKATGASLVCFSLRPPSEEALAEIKNSGIQVTRRYSGSCHLDGIAMPGALAWIVWGCACGISQQAACTVRAALLLSTLFQPFATRK